MQRTNRLFEIIQILRGETRPMTAAALALRLEVSTRTIYRDIAALQAMRTPIEGEAGLGYILRRSYDLPPLNFDPEEIVALRVGLSMLARTGDGALQAAATRICTKVDALRDEADWLDVAPWGAPLDDPAKGCVSKAALRQAISDCRKLRLLYRDETGAETRRIVRPLAMIYHLDCVMLAAWCELRGALRHFRTDRMWEAEPLDARFPEQAETLRALWREAEAGAPVPAQPLS
ncbi:helix-turn-helix transcriptional regulator [Ponticoccus alexandrii]|uniref:HTH domain-containing protein n=1 Tax=Ponticoccus alexandrii TaxID=1943633 RepID=A0ABX7F742_9RHOB|nr:YafY family protein [Ponticoccus alexandrii]QRF65409.1 HTH domain-containing protein [Ponticoccus alexandrii]